MFLKIMLKRFKENYDVLEGDEKKEFLKGAEIAYETILTSFAKGDIKTLKSLLHSEMADNFDQAIKLEIKKILNQNSHLLG